MLRRQLRDFRFGDACMSPIWQELKWFSRIIPSKFDEKQPAVAGLHIV
jgi:hypothetical protein